MQITVEMKGDVFVPAFWAIPREDISIAHRWSPELQASWSCSPHGKNPNDDGSP